MGYKMKGFSGFVTKKPGDKKKEIKVKTDSSKLYGVDWKGYEPPVTKKDKE